MIATIVEALAAGGWRWVAAAVGGALAVAWVLRPVRIPTDPLVRQIEELENDARKLEEPGGVSSADDGDRLSRLRAILRRRRDREG